MGQSPAPRHRGSREAEQPQPSDGIKADHPEGITNEAPERERKEKIFSFFFFLFSFIISLLHIMLGKNEECREKAKGTPSPRFPVRKIFSGAL